MLYFMLLLSVFFYCRSECAVLHAPALRALPEDERCEGTDLLGSSQNPRVQHP